MKPLLLLFCFLSFLSADLIAQHCPFDGGHLVAVHLTDAKGKPILNISKTLTLVEINNPVAKSCTYAEGLLSKNFLPTKQALQQNYDRFWKNWIEPNYKDWTLLNNGYYAITLNQAEESCMMKKDNDFNYRTREFEIHYQNNGLNQKVKVNKDNIYSLCTNGGSWTRIVPIEIKIKTL